MDGYQPTIIIITGRPAAGKSTLAKWLSKELKILLVSKDVIREELFDRLGWKDRGWAQQLGRASVDMMFHFAKAALAVGQSIILDNTFNPAASEERFRTLLDQYNARSIQIICDAENEILYRRFKSRFELGVRHPGHGDEVVLRGLPEFLATEYFPFLDIGGSAIEVDTTDFEQVDYPEILERIKSLLNS